MSETPDRKFGTVEILVGGFGIFVVGVGASAWGIRRGLRNVKIMDKSFEKRAKKQSSPTTARNTGVKHEPTETERDNAVSMVRKSFVYGSALSCSTFALGTALTAYALDVSSVTCNM